MLKHLLTVIPGHQYTFRLCLHCELCFFVTSRLASAVNITGQETEFFELISAGL